MKTLLKKVFVIILTLTVLIGALPVGAIYAFAAEVSNPADAQVGDTTITKTNTPPEDVDGGIWVLEKSGYTCGALGLDYAEHIHGDGNCLYLSCEHYQRDLLSDAHDLSCYGNEETSWEKCPGGDHSHTATESGYTVYSNSALEYLWQPIYKAADAEYRANNPKPSGLFAAAVYEAKVLEYANNAVTNTTFCCIIIKNNGGIFICIIYLLKKT